MLCSAGRCWRAMGWWPPRTVTSLGGLQWLLLALGAASPLERRLAADAVFISRKVWKLLPRSALVLKCVSAGLASPRWSVLLSSAPQRQSLSPCGAAGSWARVVNLEALSNKGQVLHVLFSDVDLAPGRLFQRKVSRNERARLKMDHC